MSTGNYDCYLEISIVTHRRISVDAASMAEATRKAEAIAQAWMPAELLGGAAKLPATEEPAMIVKATVILRPHDVAPEDLPVHAPPQPWLYSSGAA